MESIILIFIKVVAPTFFHNGCQFVGIWGFAFQIELSKNSKLAEQQRLRAKITFRIWGLANCKRPIIENALGIQSLECKSNNSIRWVHYFFDVVVFNLWWFSMHNLQKVAFPKSQIAQNCIDFLALTQLWLWLWNSPIGIVTIIVTIGIKLKSLLWHKNA